MHPNPYRSLLRKAAPLALAFCSLILMALPGRAQPAATAMVSGFVNNAGTGAYLTGAQVQIPELGRETGTDSRGAFALRDLPPGEYEMVVSYPGLDARRERVRVEAGTPAVRNFELGTSAYHLEKMVIVGDREGNAASIAQQRQAENIVNVVAVDAYGNVADGNLGNFFQRLPGVAVSKGDGGYATGIMLRGAPPDLSLVTMDGTRIAEANSGGGRAVDISRIPAELIKQVEVNKALTPDMDVDGIGGSANLTTKSAFDFKNRYVHYRVAASLNTYRDGNPWQPYYTLTAMDKFGKDKKLGVALTGSYNKIVNPLDRVIGQYAETDYRNTQARLLDDVLTREKSGLGLKLEYRFDSDSAVWLNSTYTHADQTSERQNWVVSAGGARRIADYSRVSRTAIFAGTAARDSANQTAGVAPGFTPTYTELLSASLINQPAAIGPIISDQYSLDGGFRKAWGGLKLEGRVTYSFADYETNSQVASFTLPAIGVAIDTSSGMPVYTQLYGTTTIWAGSDFSRYTMNYQYQPSEAQEEFMTAQLDLTREFDRARFPWTLRAGLKARRQDRDFVTNNPRWNYVGPDRVLGRNTATGLNDDNLAQFVTGPSYALFRGQYPAFDHISVASVEKAFADHPEYFVATNATNDIRNTPPSVVTEDVLAGYIMGDMRVGRRLRLLAGVRYERTNVDAVGTFTTNAVAGVTTTSRKGSYDDLFPSVHATYALQPNLLVRAAYSTSMSRPSLRNLSPTTTVSESLTGGLGTVTQNNVNLGPQRAQNYDLMLEYYLKPAGVISAGVFRKDITDFIATFRSTIASGPDNGFDGDYAGYTLNTSTNLGTAQIEGIEFNYSQQLTMLPKPFDGLNLFANYTELRTSGSYDNGATELANFVPRVVNAGLGYAFRRVNLQVVYNYKSPYLLTYSPTPVSSVYQTQDQTVDVNLSYKFRPWLNLYVDMTNVFNHAPASYSLDTSRSYIQQVWGPKLTIGINGRF